MRRHFLSAAIIALATGALHAAPPQGVPPLRPTLPAPQATELEKLEASFGIRITPQGTKRTAPEPVHELHASKEDEAFLEKAAGMNLAVIEIGVAGEKSETPEIQNLARRLVRGHKTAQKQLQRLASQKGISLPTQPDNREKIDALLQKTGHDFDKQFLQDQAKGQQEALLFFEKEAKRTTDVDIKAWAEHMITGLKTDLAFIKEVQLQPVAEQPAKKQKRQRRPQRIQD